MMKKPSVLSGLGLAACAALVVTFLLPFGKAPMVQAATIMEKLNQQVEQSQVLEVTIDNVTLEEAFLEGTIQISQLGIAGDLEVKVDEGDGEKIELDLALAIGPDGGWVLIRKLVISDPDVQAVLNAFLPAGSDTLVILPGDELGGDITPDIMGEIGDILSADVFDALREAIESQEIDGATIENQRDGTVLLTLPLDSAETLAALERLHAAGSSDDDEEKAKRTAHHEIAQHVHGDDELIGSTLKVVYDPATQLVRSFTIEDFGDSDGSISVTIGEGEPDPARFDSSRVTTPQTRTLDLSMLKEMFHGS